MKKKIIMKELSIEEKAKAYDKAIERAKGEYAKFEGMLPGDVLEEVFPELKESNDERTRKWLIEMVEEVRKANPSNADHNGNCSEAIAWLEKQVKCEIDYPQNHQDSNCPNGCIVLEDFNGGEGFYKVHLDYLNKKQVEEIEEMIRVWNKELKTSNENIKDCIGMCLTDVDEQRFKDYNTNLKDCLAWLEKQGKQKPVECCADKLWTEFRKQVAYLMASSYNREYEYTKGYVEWVAQSLFRYAKNEIEQKPAEWSEEDKTMLCYMEGHLEYLKNDKGYSSSEDQIMLKRQLEWLKSLKDRVQPQNTWKPTEEQIGAVEKALSLAKNCGEEYSFDLRTLLEQLKAL